MQSASLAPSPHSHRPYRQVLWPSLVAAALSTVALASFGMVASGCSSAYVDDDHKNSLARQIIPDLKIKDGVDVAKGDRVDYKKVTPLYNGKVTLDVTVGDPWGKPHTLTGQIGVYTQRADLLSKATVTPSETKYKLTFPAEAHVSYAFKIEGVKGAAPYEIAYSQVPEVADPCDGVTCEDGETCEEGQCVGDDAPKAACPDGCPRGHFCSEKKQRCVKKACFGVKCKRGSYCSGGRCIKKRKPKPAKKVEVVSTASNVGPIGASVIQVQPKGSKSVVLLGRGKKHNVKIGDRGTVGGFSFKVVRVYPTRCKALVNAPANKVSASKRARIVRK